MWRYWTDREQQCGSIRIFTEWEAKLQRQKEIDNWQECYGPMPAFTDPEEYDDWGDVTPYATDLNAAMQLVEVVRKEGWTALMLWPATSTKGLCRFGFTSGDSNIEAEAETPAVAICHAFLAVKGIK